MLIWNDNGPWLQTIVYSEEIDHDFPMPHKDVLEQFIAYEVPQFDPLSRTAAADSDQTLGGDARLRSDDRSSLTRESAAAFLAADSLRFPLLRSRSAFTQPVTVFDAAAACQFK